MRSAQNLCFVVNRFYALFRLNGSSKPSLTSKPLLTIALKILKTIEKPLVPMVGPPKKHSMVMVQLCQNHWKTIDGNGGLKKNINHSIALKNWPSLWSRRYISIGNDAHLSTSTVRKLTVCKGKVCLHAAAAVHVTTTCSFACQRFRIPNQNNSLGWKISGQFWHIYRFAPSRWTLV